MLKCLEGEATVIQGAKYVYSRLESNIWEKDNSIKTGNLNLGLSYIITTVPVGQSTSSTPGLQQSVMQSVGVPMGVGHSVGCSFFVNSSVVHTSSWN